MSAEPELFEERMARRAEERGDLSTAALWRRIKVNVDRAPALGPAQKALLRTLLTGPQSAPTSKVA